MTSDGLLRGGTASLYQQVALLATANGTQIAVQVGPASEALSYSKHPRQ